ncbi:hypothetical protein [Dyadobacter sp. CY326]|uniref:hypothetical protein n=1 Tax=Dyadobacter sp. CY326 TaxID=2907300 RepID=UPI001F314CF3|nr:hypothetical protein [Dyadobacter sp. CY326]MCE7067392.1 hypothetical protein [Dyadobacter sp. CY326]
MDLKKDFYSFFSSTILTWSMVLLFVSRGAAQDAFKIKWSMDNMLAGVSNHANFVPNDAVLVGGANTNALNDGYGLGGAVVAAYVVRPWPIALSNGRYMEFAFSAKSFKYNISSISLRLRRSPDGPTQFTIRTSMDGFASDLSASSLVKPNLFYTFSVPAEFNNLSENTFSFRIYGYSPSNIHGTLWFDEIIVNGEVLAIVLPIDLTYFKASSNEGKVQLSWETGWEKNSKEFVIERSTDSQTFEAIGTVAANGETDGRTPYAFVDEKPGPGTHYYRLRMIDLDDRFALSPNVAVSIISDKPTFYVAPNPASASKISVFGTDINPDALQFSDPGGSPRPFYYQIDALGYVDLYPITPLSPGLYLLTYQNNGRKEHAKVLVP